MNCVACGKELHKAIASKGLALDPGCEPLGASVDQVATELFALIASGIDNQPRSLQKRVGPSEIGTPCQRRLGYKLAGIEPVNTSKTNYKAFIGTGVHEQIAQILAGHEVGRDVSQPHRWLVEEKVFVDTYGPDATTLDGNTDLVDTWHGMVFDWKITTKNKIREEYRPHGPGAQYEVQAHTYGLGWARRGIPVRNVAIVFLTRDGEFTDRHVWSAPYDEQIALDAIRRLDGTAHLVGDLGPEIALPLLPTASAYCSFCPFFKDGSTNPARMCAGHPTDVSAPDALSRLIA